MAYITGTKVVEDDRTRWFILCDECGRKQVSDEVLDWEELKPQLEAHEALHKEDDEV